MAAPSWPRTCAFQTQVRLCPPIIILMIRSSLLVLTWKRSCCWFPSTLPFKLGTVASKNGTLCFPGMIPSDIICEKRVVENTCNILSVFSSSCYSICWYYVSINISIYTVNISIDISIYKIIYLRIIYISYIYTFYTYIYTLAFNDLIFWGLSKDLIFWLTTPSFGEVDFDVTKYILQPFVPLFSIGLKVPVANLIESFGI